MVASKFFSMITVTDCIVVYWKLCLYLDIELKNDYQFKDLSKSVDIYHPISQKALILCRFGLAYRRSVRLPASFFDDYSHRLHGGVLEIWHD